MVPDLIRNAFLDPRGIVQVTPMPSGMSGAAVFRCSTSNSFATSTAPKSPTSYALKRWPVGTAVSRVREVHRVIASGASSCSLLPRFHHAHPSNQTCVTESNGALWEMVDWLPGKALPLDATIDQIAMGGKAIAAVHESLRCQGTWSQVSPGVQQRWNLIQGTAKWLPSALNTELAGRVHPAVLDPLCGVVNLLRARWKWNSEQIQLKLSIIRSAAMRSQYVLRDVHREHLLFQPKTPPETGFFVSGVIDFDATRVDSPALDLARWGSSFTIYDQDPAAVVESILAGYLARAPLSNANEAAELRKLVSLFSEASGWLSLVNWVKWLVIESRQFQDFQSVAGRLRRLVNLRDVSPL